MTPAAEPKVSWNERLDHLQAGGRRAGGEAAGALNMTTRRWAAVSVAVAIVVTGCSGGDGTAADDDGASLGETVPVTAATAPPLPPEAPPGTGVMVTSSATSAFSVTGCQLEADPSEPAGAQTLVLVTGTGTTEGGVGFSVEIKRFATGTDVRTYTDTITYSDAARILQAQRIEVNGEVSDLRDPAAVSSMIRTRADGVAASGLAGPPGEGEGADGTVGFAVDATCAS